MDHTVLAVVIVYIAMIVTAAASPVNFVSAGKIRVFLDKTSATPSRDDAVTTCKNKGGILLADYTPAVQEMYMEPFVNAGSSYLCQSTSSGWTRNCYGAFTEGQATEVFPKCFVVRREGYGSSPFDPDFESKQCPYRWSLGWFGRYTNDLGQVGVNFYGSSWANLTIDGSDVKKIPTRSYMRHFERMQDATYTQSIYAYAGGPANDYSQGVMWNASYQCFYAEATRDLLKCLPPHGNPSIALGARQLSNATGGYHGVRVDAPDMPTNSGRPRDSPFALNNYVVACQWQGVEANYYASTTLPPQPAMVPDWKGPTWMQSHWWVIYLVVAVVLLALLVAFIVWYECKLCAEEWDDDDTETSSSSSSSLSSDATETSVATSRASNVGTERPKRQYPSASRAVRTYPRDAGRPTRADSPVDVRREATARRNPLSGSAPRSRRTLAVPWLDTDDVSHDSMHGPRA